MEKAICGNFGSDITSLWVAGKLISQGINPYGSSHLHHFFLLTNCDVYGGENFYPPYSIWILYLLGLFSRHAAIFTVSMLGLLSIFLSARNYLKIIPGTPPSINLFFLTGLCIIYPFVTMSFLWGNPSLFFLFLTTTGYLFLSNKNYLSAGLIDSLLLVKPQFGGLIVLSRVILVGPANSALYYVGILSSLLAQSLLSIYIYNTAFSDFPIGVSQFFFNVIPGQSLVQLTQTYFNISFSINCVIACSTAIYFSLAIYFTKNIKSLFVNNFFIIIPLTLLLTPYYWKHYASITLPAVLYLSKDLLNNRPFFSIVYMLIIFNIFFDYGILDRLDPSRSLGTLCTHALTMVIIFFGLRDFKKQGSSYLKFSQKR